MSEGFTVDVGRHMYYVESQSFAPGNSKLIAILCWEGYDLAN